MASHHCDGTLQLRVIHRHNTAGPNAKLTNYLLQTVQEHIWSRRVSAATRYLYQISHTQSSDPKSLNCFHSLPSPTSRSSAGRSVCAHRPPSLQRTGRADCRGPQTDGTSCPGGRWEAPSLLAAETEIRMEILKSHTLMFSSNAEVFKLWGTCLQRERGETKRLSELKGTGAGQCAQSNGESTTVW